MFGSDDSGGGMFGSSGLFGGASGGGQSKEFGSSSATATSGGNTYGLQFDQQTLIVLAVSLAGVAIAAIGLILLLRRH